MMKEYGSHRSDFSWECMTARVTYLPMESGYIRILAAILIEKCLSSMKYLNRPAKFNMISKIKLSDAAAYLQMGSVGL